jgi:hypothetical protein
MDSSLPVNLRRTDSDVLLNDFDFFSAVPPERLELEFVSNLNFETPLPASLSCDPPACLRATGARGNTIHFR